MSQHEVFPLSRELPQELLFHLFSLIDIKYYGKLSQVSVSWSQVINSMWGSITELDLTKMLAPLSFLVNVNRRVQNLRFVRLDPPLLARKMVAENNTCLDPFVASVLLQNNDTLKHVHTHSPTLAHYIVATRMCCGLNSLVCETEAIFTAESVLNLLMAYPQLTNTSIFLYVTGRVVTLVKQWPPLEHICVASLPVCTLGHLQKILNALPQLKTLTIRRKIPEQGILGESAVAEADRPPPTFLKHDKLEYLALGVPLTGCEDGWSFPALKHLYLQEFYTLLEVLELMFHNTPLLQNLIVLLRLTDDGLLDVLQRIALKIPLISSFGGIIKASTPADTQLLTKYLCATFPNLTSVDIKERYFSFRDYREQSPPACLNAVSQNLSLSVVQLHHHFAGVKCIQLHDCSISNEFCRSLLEVCTEITLLSLHDCGGVNDHLFDNASSSSLKGLILRGKPRLTYRSLHNLQEKFPNLDTLFLHNYEGVDKEVLATIKEYVPNLKRLDLELTTLRNPALYATLTCLRHLTTFTGSIPIQFQGDIPSFIDVMKQALPHVDCKIKA